MSSEHGQGCLFCGGDASLPDHRCDGKQGEVEALLAEHPETETSVAPKAPQAVAEPFVFNPRWDDGLPLLASGLTPETFIASEAAAISVEDHRLTQRREVFEVIRRAGPMGATDEEIQQELGIGGSSERPRRIELWELDQITIRRTPEGEPVKRLTRTRRWAIVWVVQKKGPV